MLKCGRCPRSAEGGVLVQIKGEPTGHNQNRYLLCADCHRDLMHLLRTSPDAEPVAKVVDKQQVADRFLRKGTAQ